MTRRRSDLRFWLRWSWRDLRSRWLAVAAIGLVLAIGSGVYAGLGSTATWRRLSNDESFAALNMHDLRVELSPGTFAPQGDLLDAAGSIEARAMIDATAERLIVPSQIETDPIGDDEEPILVSARLVGMIVAADAPVDTLWVRDGRAPGGVAGGPGGVLEAKFADQRNLPQQGRLAVAGRGEVRYTGLGTSPEDFFYEGPEGTVFAPGELAILYLPLETTQEIAGRSGAVNDLVLTLAEGADRDLVQAELSTAMADRGLGVTVSTRDDADAVRVLYEDIDNDQRFWNALSALVLFAAALAAFNLISRIVEAQRREIGIGMAMGVPRRMLAIRPLLIGSQVAVLGAVLGVVVGLLIGLAFGDLLRSLVPMPVHRTPFQPGVYAQAALLGLVVPLVACTLPVWRAVRVEPIEAIRTGHLAARTNRLTGWTGRLALPGSTLSRMPIRNVLRTPRRTALTAIGVGAAITALVAILGMLDSFGLVIDRGEAELTRGGDDRVAVQLDTFYPADSPVLAAIAAEPTVERVDAGLRLPATAAVGAGRLDLLVELVDLEDSVWTPTMDGEVATDGPGIVIARKAADDLGVEPGDSVRLRHPTRSGTGTFAMTESSFVVRAIHANPIRTFAFADLDDADVFGLRGSFNLLNTFPAEGATSGQLQRAIFDLPGVASSQPVARLTAAIDEAIEQFLGFLYVTSAAVLVLALLIAFNATRITVEEREREHATMRAFGLPLRSVLAVVMKESALVGAVATVIGLAAGAVFLRWMLSSLAATTLPDVGIDANISIATVLIAAAVGILAVATAPLLLIRRLRRMNLPDSLRVME